MDPFWGITLSVLAISRFWKRERRIKAERRGDLARLEEATEKEKKKAVMSIVDGLLKEQPTEHQLKLEAEEMEAQKAAKEAQKQRDRDIAELRKQGFTDELIATIIPTINNGQ